MVVCPAAGSNLARHRGHGIQLPTVAAGHLFDCATSCRRPHSHSPIQASATLYPCRFYRRGGVARYYEGSTGHFRYSGDQNPRRAYWAGAGRRAGRIRLPATEQQASVALVRRCWQLIIHNRSRKRAPNLTTKDRVLLGFMSFFLSPRRMARAAIIIKPSTLLSFQKALKKRKVSPVVFAWWRQKTRTEGTVERSHQHHCRDEAAQPSIWVSAHRTPDQIGVWIEPG